MEAPTENLKVAPDDEAYWLSISATMKPLYVNTQLVNTRRGPAPLVVREKVRSLVDLSLSYELDEHEPFRDMKESGSSAPIRSMLADYFGAAADEIALTRNAMEGIATVLNGFRLKPGDEIVATNLCYDSNLAILRQRALRENITIRLVNLPLGPTSDSDILARFEAAIGEKTKLVSIPHIFANTGLVLPVQKISHLARQRGAFTFVDGAHSAGHIPFRIEDLGCDGFAACLHKWMHGPRGTGFLYIRRDEISHVWPLFATWSGKPNHSIEKFEEVGTVFKALPAAIPEAIIFNQEIGQAEKTARLRYLRNRWAARLSTHERFRLLTDIEVAPGTACGAFVIEGMESEELARILLDEFDINVKVFELEDPLSKGIHLSAGLANTVEQIDRFVDAVLRY
ncbi:PLP-dependent transferase [Melanomma pulvis-pyrius CBS 109.77]|uniref:PLP-dependent transferase n=1 Tax=Melanomma pulvis-pyrius CBS 109.77 TaxID=1314802 RepID=A0A6A6XNC4_9PLEO|nr:PLP-dependent transferase [Melanomma pulvis-pyrius CBS 109.77]